MREEEEEEGPQSRALGVGLDFMSDPDWTCKFLGAAIVLEEGSRENFAPSH